jgi:hypothetical protein
LTTPAARRGPYARPLVPQEDLFRLCKEEPVGAPAPSWDDKVTRSDGSDHDRDHAPGRSESSARLARSKEDAPAGWVRVDLLARLLHRCSLEGRTMHSNRMRQTAFGMIGRIPCGQIVPTVKRHYSHLPVRVQNCPRSRKPPRGSSRLTHPDP